MKVSIITPSFNHAHFIRRTIESVLNQDYIDIEYIIMDGGSTDGTQDILKEFDGRLVWDSKSDGGQSDAINKGIRKATGEIICYLNSDDVLEHGAISKVVDFFENNNDVQWAYGKCRIVDLEDNEIRKPITMYKNLLLRKYNYKKLLIENYISQPSTFWRASLHNELGYFDENEKYVMDYEFWCRVGSKYQAGVIPYYLANFRMYSTSKSGNLNNSQFDDELRVARKYCGDNKFIIIAHTLNKYKIKSVYRLMSFFG